MTKRWDTLKVAKWAGAAGVAIGAIHWLSDPSLATGGVGFALGYLVGWAIGCAIIGAAASALRNVFVR